MPNYSQYGVPASVTSKKKGAKQYGPVRMPQVQGRSNAVRMPQVNPGRDTDPGFSIPNPYTALPNPYSAAGLGRNQQGILPNQVLQYGGGNATSGSSSGTMAEYQAQVDAANSPWNRSANADSTYDSYQAQGLPPIEEEGPTGYQGGGAFSFNTPAPGKANIPALADFVKSFNSNYVDPYAAQLVDLDKRKAEALQNIGFGSTALNKDLTANRDNLDAYYKQSIADQAAAGTKAQEGLAESSNGMAELMAKLQANTDVGIDTSSAQETADFSKGQLAAETGAADVRAREDQRSQYAAGTGAMGVGSMIGTEGANDSRRNFDSNIARTKDAQSLSLAEQQNRAQAAWLQEREFLTNQANTEYNRWADSRDDAYTQWRDADQTGYGRWADQNNWDRADDNAILDREASTEQARIASQAAQQAAYKPTPMESLIEELTNAGIKQPGNFTSRFSKFNAIGDQDPGEVFNEQFGRTNAASQDAFKRYLIDNYGIKF